MNKLGTTFAIVRGGWTVNVQPDYLWSSAHMKSQKRNNQQSGDRNSEVQHQASLRRKETAEQWWGRISPIEKIVAQQIALMMEEINESKRIEIRKELKSIKARFIHILKQPEKGCLSAIMLPEPPTSAWN